jgi:uncharacterized protein YxjI
MKKFILFFLVFLASASIFAQNFTGQWKGSFIDKSISAYSWGDDRCDYVLDLEANGTAVTGYSYTYFTSEGQKFFTICKLKGKIDKLRKHLEITETERTKTNIPQKIINSFQIHKLNWRKEGNNEILEGNWVPAPGQSAASTGFGTTILTKRQLTEISTLAKRKNTLGNIGSKKVDAAITEKTSIAKTTTKPIIAKIKPTTVKKNTPVVSTTKTLKPNLITPVTIKKDSIKNPVAQIKTPTIKIKPVLGFEKRASNIIQTINVVNEKVKLELYDNGEIDGDSVSIFYNGELILSHKKLTNQPIKLELPIKSGSENELSMYADNLGTIPPNTALMIVMDGNKRYEVRITSDLKKTGVIRFVHE